MNYEQLQSTDLTRDVITRPDIINSYYEFIQYANFIAAEQDYQQPSVDTIGGARKYLESGKTSDLELLEHDCERALQEALRKNSWELFQPLTHRFDHEKGEFTAFGQPVSQMLEAGLRVKLPGFERERRVLEYAEEQTLNLLAKRGEVNTSLVTFSLCPEDQSASEHGYVSENQKMMIRSSYIYRDPSGEIKKSLEQASLAGYSRSTIEKYFELQGVELPAEWKSGDVLSRHLQFDGRTDLVELIAQLDAIEGSGLVMNEETSLSYRELRAVSSKRRDMVSGAVDHLKYFSLDLARRGYDYVDANKLFYQEVTDVIHAICAARPEYSAGAFNLATAELYTLAEQLDRAGSDIEAANVREQAKQFAPEVSFCGMGASSTSELSMSSEGEAKTGRCLELTRCPLCSDLNYDGSKRSGKPKVNVFAEMTENHIKCTRCDAKLDKRTGKFVSQGKIATKSK